MVFLALSYMINGAWRIGSSRDNIPEWSVVLILNVVLAKKKINAKYLTDELDGQ